MILSKKAIRTALHKGAITIEPFAEDQIDKAHIDLHLGHLPNDKIEIILEAKSFLTAKTREKITLSEELCAFIEGRAGLAKQGISVEQSSSLIEPGSDNQMTLEIFNASDQPVALTVGQPIAKMYLAKVTDKF